jgi:hypothetical protein
MLYSRHVHQNDAHRFLLKLFNAALERKYKDQTEAISTPASLMKDWPC